MHYKHVGDVANPWEPVQDDSVLHSLDIAGKYLS